MISELFVQSQEAFERSLSLLNIAFNPKKRIPEQVFRYPFAEFAFAEFDWVMSADFWKSLKKSHLNIDEELLLVAVLEPDPCRYFYEVFGYYNFFKLSLNSSSDDYWAALQEGPENSPADAMLYNSEVIVWVPESLKWAIWGERSVGVCAIGFDKLSIIDREALSREWMPAGVALADVIPANFRGRKVPQEFAETLSSNYAPHC
ncbi:MAG: hypothetical protein AB7N91_25015 [Candidatus Tectimicrobiota bacterium]